ncbi:MAG: MBL fold metallo-hydrolase [Candidatus Paceibacterota bacterium]
MKDRTLQIFRGLKWYLLIFLVFISFFLWYVAVNENREGFLTVSFLNVEQGDSIFIESPTGVQVVIDGGPNKFIMREISKQIPWYDRSLDAIIITHPDKDHYEGFASLLDKYSVKVVIEAGASSETQSYTFLEKKIADKKIPKVLARRGQIVDIGGGAYIEILFPDRDISGLNSNDGSIVSKLVYGNTSVMLTGDSPQSIENYLISLDKGGLDSDILKAGHHGSRTSSSDLFVSAVSPEYTIISAEKNSRYGHPHKEVLDILEKYKTEILATYELGTITFISDGNNLRLVK